MTNIKNSSRQRGVALLFALGILSLLLVMGVAFLGNALISQKIAVNSQESASAKHLGRTAVDRVLSHLAIFNLAQAQTAGNFYAADGSSVYSRLSTAAFDNAALTIKRDGIYTQNNPLLSLHRGQEGNPAIPLYDGSKSLAEWVYVHEDGKFSNGSGTFTDGTSGNSRIIGRFAYQVLPQSQASRLSLYAQTAGATRRAGEDLDSATTARIPQKHRWGVDVDELAPLSGTMFAKYWRFDTSELCDPLHDFDNFVNILSGGKSGADFFYGDTAATESRKRFVEHIFTEGRGRTAREAYWGGDGWYPRFNLGRFSYYWNADTGKRVAVKNTGNTWYQRFLELSAPPADAAAETTEINKIRNDKKVVDALIKAQTTSGRYTDAFLYDGQYEVLGLPFLRRIGNDSEKGGFDSVEALRRQVAANLNDYCDEDAIPTSDVAAKDWSTLVNSVSGLPTYTGNEKTPYINEVALGLKVSDGKFNSASGKFEFEGKLSAELIAEIIRVYKSIVPDMATVQLQGRVRSLDVTFKVAIKGKASGTYTKGDDTQGSVSDLELTYDNTSSDDAGEPARFADKDFTIQFNTDVIGTGPYWVKNAPIGSDQVFKVDLYKKLKAIAEQKNSDVEDKDVTFSVNPEKIRISVSKVAFNFGNLVLTAELDKGDGTGTKERTGIDFVRFVSASETGTYATLSNAGTALAEEYDSLVKLNEAGLFHVGLMQAIDPRQNLNASCQSDGANEKKSDWRFSLESSLTMLDKSGWDWNTLNTRIGSGFVNVCSKAKAPQYADAANIHADDRDAEVVEDTAWQGDAIDKHISTAVIRNAPMMSPWELGFIHRGIPFQTINLLKAGGINNNGAVEEIDIPEEGHAPGNFTNILNAQGTRYKYGDAAILDQIKMTDMTKSYGKVDFSALQNKPANWINSGTSFDTLKYEIFKSLFENLKTHQAFDFVEKVTDRAKAPTFAAGTESNLGFTIADSDFVADATVLRSKILSYADSPVNNKFKAQTTDAAREEVIGKTVNLLEGRGTAAPVVFKVVIAAQAIRDMSGPITKLDSAGAASTHTASFGNFDATVKDKDGKGSDVDTSIYYDEILGESRMLVTIERLHYFENDTPRARLRVRQIEYLD